MSSLTTIATDLINTLGLAGVSVGLFINCLGIPISSEIIIPLTGIGVRQGHINLILALAVTIGAQMLGLFASYDIGRFGGLGLISRYGKYVFISQHELERTEKAFEKYGGRLVFFGLILPGIHGFVGYPAGIAKMAIGSFAATALAGAAIWSGALLALGYFLGDHLAEIDAIFRQFGVFIVLAFILVGAYYINIKRKAIR
jgi:membrane protein DedA with SNARE-associated domain